MADLSITASLVTWQSGAKETGIAGASITAGQAVYYDAATGLVKKAIASATAPEAEAVGIALHGSLTGQPITYAKNGANIVIGAVTAKNVTYVVSANSAGIAPQADLTSGQRITRLGWATDTAGHFVVDIQSTGTTV